MLSLTERVAILHELAESGTAVGLKILDECLEQVAMPLSVEELAIEIPAWSPDLLGQSFGEVFPGDSAAGLAMVTQTMASGVGPSRVHFVDDPESEYSICMVNLTRELGQMLIVEGIEEHRQLGILLDMGVQVGQGFLLGKPMPEDLFLAEFDTAQSSV